MTKNGPRAASYLSPPDLMRLHWACSPVNKAFPEAYGVYLVGSALQRPDYRDIDLRMILPDEDFMRLFGGRGDGFRLLRFLNVVISAHIQQASGLSKPIDFQVQPMSVANDGNHEGGRNPMGKGERAGGVDVPMHLSNSQDDTDDEADDEAARG